MRLPAVLACLVLAACGPAEPPPVQPTVARSAEEIPRAEPLGPDAEKDADNLLNVAYGASVVSRTGESTLETSAMHAIDGMSTTVWSSSPGDPNATLVYSLAAPSRIEKLGITTPNPQANLPDEVRFESSLDGTSWREQLVLRPKDSETVDVRPFDAQYLRVTTHDPKDYYAIVASFHALGRELEPPKLRSLEGCWTVNQQPARFTQQGARITGTIGDTHVEGGTDGRVAQLLWRRGAMWGYAAVTVAPDGRTLSATTFHEEPRASHVGAAWFGEKSACGAASAATAAPPLRKHWPLFGLAFDENDELSEAVNASTLDAVASFIRKSPDKTFRLVAHEFRHRDPEENRRRAAARLDAVREALRVRGVDPARVELRASGSSRPDTEVTFAVQRLLWSRIDLEFSGT